MDEALIQELSSLVEKACRSRTNVFGYGIWSHHIRPMLGLADALAVDAGADREVVALAVLLHDLAAILDSGQREEHHIHGAALASRLLAARAYPPDRSARVQACILNHRGSVPKAKTSPEEICVADADALAHMLELPSLFYVAYREHGLGIDEGRDWVRGKLERDRLKMSRACRRKYKTRIEEMGRMLGGDTAATPIAPEPGQEEP